VIWRSRSGARTPVSRDDMELLPRRAEVLRRYQADGWRLLGLSWQPEVAAGIRTPEEVTALFAHANAELGIEADCVFCPHGAGPAVCWCRKPLPGLGVLLVERHQVDVARSVHVGEGASDATLARVLGLSSRRADELFA
jgi:histidinol phosphatase-like enzyme